MPDIVYVLINPAMPGIVKIGKTTRDDPQIKMNELYNESVPLPFECAIALEIEDEHAEGLKRALHIAFAPDRINPSKEFFEIELYQVEAVLRQFYGKDVTVQVNRELRELSVNDREAVKHFKKRRPSLNFAEMRIPVGATLVSIETGREVIVVAERRVSYRGEDISLGEVTRRMLGVDYNINPTPHWQFEGRVLLDIYQETYGEK